MRRYSLLFLVLTIVLLSSCAYRSDMTLSEVKEGRDCIMLSGDAVETKWNNVQRLYGDPDIAPPPTEDLSSNARVYRRSIVILYTGREKVMVDGKTRFHEVIKGVEMCK